MKGSISTILLLLLILALIIVLIKTGLLEPIKEWLAMKYYFPYACEKVYPTQYKYMIYDYCGLASYNVSSEDIIVKTYMAPSNKCHFQIMIRGNVVYEFDLGYKESKVIKCDDIIKWLSESR